MRTRTRALAAALMLLALAGCRKPDVWPLQQGNEWVYHEHIGFGMAPTGQVRHTVESVTQSATGQKAVIAAYRNDEPEPFQRIELLKTKQGVYEIGRTVYIQGQEIKIAFKPLDDAPAYLITENAEVGRTWNFKYQAEDPVIGASTTFSGQGMIETMEKITPKAGSFHAMRVALRAREENNTGFEDRTYWFRRGVGPVKIEIQHYNENTVLMLERARIGNKVIGRK